MNSISREEEKLENKTTKQLLEMLAGQQRLQSNRKFMDRLPDKGEKINTCIKKLEALITEKKLEEKQLNDMTECLSQRLTLDSKEEHFLPPELQILENRPSSKVISDAEFRTERPRYLTNRTLLARSTVQDEANTNRIKESAMRTKPKDQAKYPLVLLSENPDHKCTKTQTISIAESYQLQKEQYERLKAYQFDRAVAKLTASSEDQSHVDAPHIHYEGTNFTRYRDLHSSDESDADECLDQVE